MADLVSRVHGVSAALLRPCPWSLPYPEIHFLERKWVHEETGCFSTPMAQSSCGEKACTTLKCWNGRLAHSRSSFVGGNKMGPEFCCFSERELPLPLSSSKRKGSSMLTDVWPARQYYQVVFNNYRINTSFPPQC